MLSPELGDNGRKSYDGGADFGPPIFRKSALPLILPPVDVSLGLECEHVACYPIRH